MAYRFKTRKRFRRKRKAGSMKKRVQRYKRKFKSRMLTKKIKRVTMKNAETKRRIYLSEFYLTDVTGNPTPMDDTGYLLGIY